MCVCVCVWSQSESPTVGERNLPGGGDAVKVEQQPNLLKAQLVEYGLHALLTPQWTHRGIADLELDLRIVLGYAQLHTGRGRLLWTMTVMEYYN